MKRFILTGLLVAASAGPLARAAEGPDDQYIRVYNLLQQADELNKTGQKREAFEAYQSAQAGLKAISTNYPSFNQKVLQFRLNYVADKIAQFGPQAAPAKATSAPAAAPIAAPTVNTLVEKATPAAAPAADEAKLKALAEDVQRLNAEKGVLEAKLREALSAQPATVDPRELAKSEEKIRGLQKENELLKLSLEQEKTKAASKKDAAEAEAAKKSLAEVNRTLEEQKKTIAALKEEKELLQSRLKKAEAKPATTLAASTDSSAKSEALKKQVEELQAQLKAAQKANSAEAAAEKKAAKAENKQLKRLQDERDDLAKKLAETEAALKKSKEKRAAKGGGGNDEVLLAQIHSLQARMEVLEAKKVPYTAEELALFKAPEPTLIAAASSENKTPAPVAKPDTAKKAKATRDEPAGSAEFIVNARKAYKEGRYDDAEKAYNEVLKLDENNISTLGNLAVTQMQQRHLDDADKTLKRALELDADDTFNLNLMGQLRFRQNKFDEALDLLSKAARLDPKNPETQNYLGITLSQKGQREAAETALRKAIQMAPDYPSAHMNLAIVYATQNPPYIELARYHYQKAKSLGHEPNPELDKMLGKK